MRLCRGQAAIYDYLIQQHIAFRRNWTVTATNGQVVVFDYYIYYQDKPIIIEYNTKDKILDFKAIDSKNDTVYDCAYNIIHVDFKCVDKQCVANCLAKALKYIATSKLQEGICYYIHSELYLQNGHYCIQLFIHRSFVGGIRRHVQREIKSL